MNVQIVKLFAKTIGKLKNYKRFKLKRRVQ